VPNELDSRTALVTGASRGIGRAIAVELAELGARVVALGRSPDELEETRKSVLAARGQCDVLVADLRERAWYAELDRLAPELDVLVHNAAAFAPRGPFERAELFKLDELLATNVTAVVALTQHVIAGMKARQFGRIVCIGTIAAETGTNGHVLYATSKSALVGFVRSVAAEGGPHGVTCNLVLPGLIATERVHQRTDADLARRVLAANATGRAGTADEVAYVVGCLASPRASYVTGAVVPVTGGQAIGLYVRE
jgi:NAD(P)-dependent dehydrogenase (short-subunit alcohol dehydrogenase family)